jgi:TonB-dependent SusC/RagA subfamily outer membrane receptor
VSIRNRGTPLWVLDGIPVYNNNPESNNVALQAETPGDASSVEASFEETLRPGPAPTFIATMDTFTIERVELLKGPRAAIYGSRGANGVILIYTKRGVGQTREPVLSPDFTILGHGTEKEFYVPKYDVKKDAHTTPDYRATLYWNPSVITDENGNATIEFFNSDTAKQIQLSFEGISSNGILGTHLETFGEGD